MPSESRVCSSKVNDVDAVSVGTLYQEICVSNGSESPIESATSPSSSDPDISPKRESSRKLSSISCSPTFGERLKSARKLIPQFPGRRLAYSTSDSRKVLKDEDKVHINVQPKYCEDFRSFFREHYIVTEFKSLCSNHQGGVYVMPSLKTLQVWHGIIFLRAGPYRDGIFRFFIFLPDDFPDSRPLLKFTTPVFHPQIHPNGVLNLDKEFPKWERGKHSLWQIVQYMKACFYNADTWGATNEIAMNVMHNSLEDFKKKAEDCVLQSQKLYDVEMESENSVDDGNHLKVKKMSTEKFEEGKRMMLQGNFLSPRNYASH